jgi:acyl dehydratase
MYLEDHKVGERTVLGSHTFTAEAIKAFAREYDPQRFHLDEEAGRQSLYGGMCASGWHTASFCIRFVVTHRLRRNAEIAAHGERTGEYGVSPGLHDLKWHKPVFPGDTITYESETLELRELKSRPHLGLLIERYTGTNQHGELVYSFIGSVFVDRRPR